MKKLILLSTIFLTTACTVPGTITKSRSIVRDADGVIVQTIETESKTIDAELRPFNLEIMK